MTTENTKDIGSILREARGERSYRVVQKECGVPLATLAAMESGERKKCSTERLRQLANYYGVSFTELMRAAGHIDERQRIVPDKVK